MSLLRKELKQILSNKLFVITWIVILAVLTLFMCKTPSKEKTKVSGAVIGISNSDDSKYSQMLIDFIVNSDEFAKLVTVVTGSKEEINEQFYDGKLDAYLEIPDKFIANIIDINSLPVVVKISDKDTVTAVLVTNILDSYQKYISAIQLNVTGLNDCLRVSGMSQAKIIIPCFKITYSLVTNVFEKDKYIKEVVLTDYKNTSIVKYFRYAALTIVIMYGSLFAGVEILKEKNYSVLNRYLISGNSILKFICSKVIFYSIALYMLVLIPDVISTVYTKDIFNYRLMFLFLLYIITCVSMSVFLCFLTGQLNTYIFAGNMLYIVSTILGGGIIPIMYLPEKMVKIAGFTPTRLFIKNFIAVYKGMSLADIADQILICIIISVIMIMSSAVLFRKGAGKEKC